MEKLMGLAITGSVALLVLMFSISPVASSLSDAQISEYTVSDEVDETLGPGEQIEYLNVEAVEGQDVTLDLDITDLDEAEGDSLIVSVDGFTTTVDTEGEHTVSEEASSDETFIVIEAEGMNIEDVTTDYKVTSFEVNDNAGLYALVLLIFLISFAAGVWKAVV